MKTPYEDRHKKQNFSAIHATLKVPQRCPAISWKLKYKNGDGDFDEEILPLLKLLNTTTWHTVASCAGHTEKDIVVAHMGYGVNSPYRIAIYIHVRNSALPPFTELMRRFSGVSNNAFWCELGYTKDYSNLTEKGYAPFKITIFAGTKANRNKLLGKYEAILKEES